MVRCKYTWDLASQAPVTVFSTCVSRHCRQHTSGTLLSSIWSDCGCLPDKTCLWNYYKMWFQIRIHLWFMHEGAVPYFLPFCVFLNIFQWWASVGRPTGWPLVLNVWENTETTVYGAEVSDVQDVWQQIHNGREMILWRLGFSDMSNSHGSHVQLLAWKLDTLSILCNLPKVIALKSCHRDLCMYFFSCIAVQINPCSLAVYFLLTLCTGHTHFYQLLMIEADIVS